MNIKTLYPKTGKAMKTAMRCRHCDLVYVPPRIYCERCFDKQEEWVDAGTKGTVQTFTVAYVDADGSKLKQPTICAMKKPTALTADSFMK